MTSPRRGFFPAALRAKGKVRAGALAALDYNVFMAAGAEPLVLPDTEEKAKTLPKETHEPGYLVICWNDPVNFMDYVTHVFQVVFGWPKAKARKHMLQVHEQGKSLLTRETFEKAEHYVHQLQSYRLHATLEREE